MRDPVGELLGKVFPGKRITMSMAGKKIGRDAFLYMESHGNGHSCSSCRLWTDNRHKVCLVHGKDQEIDGDDVCGLHIPGPAQPNEAKNALPLVSPQESGLCEGPTSCGRCKYLENDECGLYKMLNRRLPELFELNESVKRDACCNAYVPGVKDE